MRTEASSRRSYPTPRRFERDQCIPGVDFLYTTDEGRKHWIRVARRRSAGTPGRSLAPSRRCRMSMTRGAARRVLQRRGAPPGRRRSHEDSARWSSESATECGAVGRHAESGVRPATGMPRPNYQGLARRIHPDDLARVGEAVERCAETAGDRRLRYRVSH